jgi:hypothetical protein
MARLSTTQRMAAITPDAVKRERAVTEARARLQARLDRAQSPAARASAQAAFDATCEELGEAAAALAKRGPQRRG